MIILMGLAGSGKSTQGQRLAAVMGRVWLSTGQMIRESGQFDQVINSGNLIDDETATAMLVAALQELKQTGQEVILDGYPRNLEQAQWAAEHLAGEIEQVLLIEVPKDELMQRLILRGRADDTEQVIRERFEILEHNLAGMCEILAGAGISITQIDGVGSQDEVYDRVIRAVENPVEK